MKIISYSENNIDFITSQDRREVAKWESGLLELINLCFIEARGDLYMITKSGYEFIDTLDKQKRGSNILLLTADPSFLLCHQCGEFPQDLRHLPHSFL